MSSFILLGTIECIDHKSGLIRVLKLKDGLSHQLDLHSFIGNFVPCDQERLYGSSTERAEIRYYRNSRNSYCMENTAYSMEFKMHFKVVKKIEKYHTQLLFRHERKGSEEIEITPKEIHGGDVDTDPPNKISMLFYEGIGSSGTYYCSAATAYVMSSDHQPQNKMVPSWALC